MCKEGGSLGAVSVLGTLAGLPTSTLGSTAWPWHYNMGSAAEIGRSLAIGPTQKAGAKGSCLKIDIIQGEH